jgi:hypothetical protein
MLLNFKNEHIFFALEPVWNTPGFDYKLQTHINQLVTANSDNDFIQQVEISKETLLKVFKSVSAQPEGVAAFINQQLLGALLPQLEAVSNLEAVQQGLEQPNEAASINWNWAD